jgi:hypothetical protein
MNFVFSIIAALCPKAGAKITPFLFLTIKFKTFFEKRIYILIIRILLLSKLLNERLKSDVFFLAVANIRPFLAYATLSMRFFDLVENNFTNN